MYAFPSYNILAECRAFLASGSECVGVSAVTMQHHESLPLTACMNAFAACMNIDRLHERVDRLHERVDNVHEHVGSVHERVDSLHEH